MNKKVSIIIPTYNRANLISETLDSIIGQTYQNWECIIIDDGSTDNSFEIITKYLNKDQRFKFVSRPKDTIKGPSACRNHGIDRSEGDFLLFFDDDDILHPQNLELCVSELSNKEVSFCRYLREKFYGEFNVDYDFSTEYTKFPIGCKDIEQILKNELFCITGSIIWKRECYINNRFFEQLSYAEEWEVYSRIISSGFKGVSINKCLFYGRKHASATTAVFYKDSSKSNRSYNDAILLVVKNLNEKKLLSHSILRYFIQMSLTFKEYQLFDNILKQLNLSKMEIIKWRIFYAVFPLRLMLYGHWKKIREIKYRR